MAIGVSYDDFWYGDPEIVQYAIEAERIVQKNQAILDDANAWNVGRYVMLGVGTVMSQAFSKNSQAKYPAEPILVYELDQRLAEQKRERELRRQEANFLALAAAMMAQKPNGESAN